MKAFKVIVQESAELDLTGIIEYIAVDLQEKAVAVKLYKKISEAISSLSEAPGRCAVIDAEPYKPMRIRRLIVENYSIFYFVNNETETVHILRILYNRRDWKNLVTTQ
ncbi:MAG: type II toxin-antitoxin system RelE/ParE family toxin [Clostridia bacterium]|nr:type II toxin-antitoxin system RelE/ParE family toxin [Clostridia bacterium]